MSVHPNPPSTLTRAQAFAAQNDVLFRYMANQAGDPFYGLVRADDASQTLVWLYEIIFDGQMNVPSQSNNAEISDFDTKTLIHANLPFCKPIWMFHVLFSGSCTLDVLGEQNYFGKGIIELQLVAR